MPKYKVTIKEEYTNTYYYEVEATDIQEAENKASDLHEESNLPKIEDLHFIEWNITNTQKLI